MDRQEKANQVERLRKDYQAAGALFLTEYRGLTVGQMTNLRRDLRGLQASLFVAKNRLVRLALADEKIAGLEPQLKGPTAVTFAGEDTVGVAKILAKYQQDFEFFSIRAGVLNGELLTAKDVETLSRLPSREELYAKLLGTLMGPASALARTLKAIPGGLARVLGAIRDNKEKTSA